MKLISGDKSLNVGNVVRGDFSPSGSPLFYARTFYELPVAGLVVEAFGEFRIADANRLGIAELAMSPLSVIGETFTNIFGSALTIPALVELANVPADLNSAALNRLRLVEGAGGGQTSFELFGVNRMDVKGVCYLILLFRREAPANTDHGLSQTLPLIDRVTGLPNTAGAERKLDILCHGVPQRSGNLAVGLFSLAGWRKEAANFSDELADDLISLMALRLMPWIGEGIFVSRYRSDEFLVALQDRGNFKEVLQAVYDALTGEFVAHGLSFNFTVNAGVYVRGAHRSPEAGDMLARARRAALKARLAGADGLVFDTEGTEQ